MGESAKRCYVFILEQYSVSRNGEERIQRIKRLREVECTFPEGDYFYFYKILACKTRACSIEKKGENSTPEIFWIPIHFQRWNNRHAWTFFLEGWIIAGFPNRERWCWLDGRHHRKTTDKTLVEDTVRDLKFTGIAMEKEMTAIISVRTINRKAVNCRPRPKIINCTGTKWARHAVRINWSLKADDILAAT